MIEVIVNRPSFEYDIHSLVKSFFPREDVQIHVQDTFTEDTSFVFLWSLQMRLCPSA